MTDEIIQILDLLERTDGGIITALVLYNLLRLNNLIKKVAYLEGQIRWLINEKNKKEDEKNEKN
jgi:hypothetical protein